ncbi:hypothetical protein Q3G72_024897 [Acer saccharum]|nr:hypothetical protein Q3G72_024897 [Acer saccharum]
MSQSHRLVYPELKTKCRISSSVDNFRIWKHKLDYILKLASLEEKLFKYLSRLEIDQKKNLHSSRRCLALENLKACPVVLRECQGIVPSLKTQLGADTLPRIFLQGYNVLHPMGWGAFGSPAEQYAIEVCFRDIIWFIILV